LDQQQWVCSGTFQQFTYWKHDSIPAATDMEARGVDWLSLASLVSNMSGLSARSQLGTPTFAQTIWPVARKRAGTSLIAWGDHLYSLAPAEVHNPDLFRSAGIFYR
jgi:hypothetical protein